MKYETKKKEDKPVIAICYDFDKTLSPDDMQAQGFIQNTGYDVAEFWKMSNELAEYNDMDQNLAYMFSMKKAAEGKVLFTRDELKEYGKNVELFPGVETWFERIREYGEEHGVIVEHYVISSGLKEMIEGTSVAQNGAFQAIYASSFYYDENNVAQWPAQVVNYTNKTQFLFRIEKGVLNINDDGVNSYFPPDKMRVPFRNMIYIGDSDTDVPCMKLVNTYGGHSIGVYNPETGDKGKVRRMITDNRIKYYAPADYKSGSELDELVKRIIKKTAETEYLEEKHFACLRECEEELRANSEENLAKRKLIDRLQESRSFATTHAVIEELAKCDNWSSNEVNKLLEIALNNSQVRYVINDSDVASFYQLILTTENVKKKLREELKELLE